jgi:hypothetical protein
MTRVNMTIDTPLRVLALEFGIWSGIGFGIGASMVLVAIILVSNLARWIGLA